MRYPSAYRLLLVLFLSSLAGKSSAQTVSYNNDTKPTSPGPGRITASGTLNFDKKKYQLNAVWMAVASKSASQQSALAFCMSQETNGDGTWNGSSAGLNKGTYTVRGFMELNGPNGVVCFSADPVDVTVDADVAGLLDTSIKFDINYPKSPNPGQVLGTGTLILGPTMSGTGVQLSVFPKGLAGEGNLVSVAPDFVNNPKSWTGMVTGLPATTYSVHAILSTKDNNKLGYTWYSIVADRPVK